MPPEYARSRSYSVDVDERGMLSLSIEGNIGVGKSTMLESLRSRLDSAALHVIITPEPIAEWTAVGPAKHNLLGAFYESPVRLAYTFQNYILATRVRAEQRALAEAAESPRPTLRLLERCLLTDRTVFLTAAIESGRMSPLEAAVYDEWADIATAGYPTLIPAGIVYLRAPAEDCHGRLVKRARAEEAGVDTGYLSTLETRHEAWLGVNATTSLAPPGLPPPPPELAGRLRWTAAGGKAAHKTPLPVLELPWTEGADKAGDTAGLVLAFARYAQRAASLPA